MPPFWGARLHLIEEQLAQVRSTHAIEYDGESAAFQSPLTLAPAVVSVRPRRRESSLGRPAISNGRSCRSLAVGVRLLAEIRAAGYTGGYTQLKAFVQKVRPTPAPAPVVRFETPPATGA